MGILDKLLGRSSASDLESALTDIDAEITSLVDTHTQLKGSLSSAPFEQTPGEVVALRQRIRDMADELETLAAVRDETARRLGHAQQDEAKALARRQLDGARHARAAMRKASKDFDAALDALEAAAIEMRSRRIEVQSANMTAADAGLTDEKLYCPLFHVEAAAGVVARGHGGALGEHIRGLRAMSVTKQFDQMQANDRLN